MQMSFHHGLDEQGPAEKASHSGRVGYAADLSAARASEPAKIRFGLVFQFFNENPFTCVACWRAAGGRDSTGRRADA
jgi:hypothetical protein